MKYLGIDVGTKQVGLAVSDREGIFAFPRETLPNDTNLIPHLTGLVASESIGVIVVGDARAATGGKNPATAHAEALVRGLRSRLSVPVHEVHEAWSSMEAARFAPPGKRHDDAAAAAIILQRHLDGVQRNT